MAALTDCINSIASRMGIRLAMVDVVEAGGECIDVYFIKLHGDGRVGKVCLQRSDVALLLRGKRHDRFESSIRSVR